MIVYRTACLLLLTAGFLAGVSLCAVSTAQAQDSKLYVGKTKSHSPTSKKTQKNQVYDLSKNKASQDYESWEETKAQKSSALGAIASADYNNKIAAEAYAHNKQMQALAYASNGAPVKTTAQAAPAPKMVYKPASSEENTGNANGKSGGNRLWNKFWQ